MQTKRHTHVEESYLFNIQQGQHLFFLYTNLITHNNFYLFPQKWRKYDTLRSVAYKWLRDRRSFTGKEISVDDIKAAADVFLIPTDKLKVFVDKMTKGSQKPLKRKASGGDAVSAKRVHATAVNNAGAAVDRVERTHGNV